MISVMGLFLGKKNIDQKRVISFLRVINFDENYLNDIGFITAYMEFMSFVKEALERQNEIHMAIKDFTIHKDYSVTEEDCRAASSIYNLLNDYGFRGRIVSAIAQNFSNMTIGIEIDGSVHFRNVVSIEITRGKCVLLLNDGQVVTIEKVHSVYFSDKYIYIQNYSDFSLYDALVYLRVIPRNIPEFYSIIDCNEPPLIYTLRDIILEFCEKLNIDPEADLNSIQVALKKYLQTMQMIKYNVKLHARIIYMLLTNEILIKLANSRFEEFAWQFRIERAQRQFYLPDITPEKIAISSDVVTLNYPNRQRYVFNDVLSLRTYFNL